MADINLTRIGGIPTIVVKIQAERAAYEARTIGGKLMKFLLANGMAKISDRDAMLSFIKKKSPNGVSRGDLAKRFGAKINKDQRQAILEDLARAKLIGWREDKNWKGPAAIVFYSTE